MKKYLEKGKQISIGIKYISLYVEGPVFPFGLGIHKYAQYPIKMFTEEQIKESKQLAKKDSKLSDFKRVLGICIY